MVTMAGEVLEIGGAHLDSGGYDLLGLICGSEGQLGVVTEATLRILRKPEGARPVLIGFDSNEVAGECVSDIIKAGVLPVAIEFMDRPILEIAENYAKAGYPDCEAVLIVEVEGSPSEIDAQLGLIKQIARSHNPVELREAETAEEAGRIWLGPKKRVWSGWSGGRLHVPRWDHPGQRIAACTSRHREIAAKYRAEGR